MEIKFSFSALDVWNNIKYFKDHRAYVKHRFNEMGYEVTKWNWDKNPETGSWEKDEDGITFKKNDSDLDLTIEVTGVVGKNLRQIRKEEYGHDQ